jgi:hypothetical protein|tara:strand:- start:1810 stop:2304 length:495 start_codon:yes stop_codon:yes gene_type:complete
MNEAFVYLWYDAGWKQTGGPRYYIGKHKGELDGGYVCSSKDMSAEWQERGCTHKGCTHVFGEEGHHGDFHRRILAYGEESKMYEYERSLLERRREYFNDRYYNKIVCLLKMPSGEKHPSYKHGKSNRKEYYEYNKKNILLAQKKYYKKNKEKLLEYQREYKKKE